VHWAHRTLAQDRYNIVLVQPQGFKHTPVFADVARLLEASLHSLGYQCQTDVNHFDHSAINVLLGYHMVIADESLKRSPYIVYQLEQLTRSDQRFNERWLQLLSMARAVWDYSSTNIQFLQSRGLSSAKYLPLGYHPALATIQAEIEDVDVLHYGSMNQRRREVLAELQKHCKVVHLHGVYGAPRDAAIGRSRIVLSLHLSGDDPRFQQVRVSYLLNNSRFIISEPADDNPYGDLVITAPYDQIVEVCRSYLSQPAKRQQRAAEAGKRFTAMPMEEMLKSVL
jgi:hypothetical protein